MNSKVLVLVLGVALGAVTAAAILMMQPPPAPPPPVIDETGLKRLRQDITEARNRAQMLESANAELSTELAKLRQPATPSAATSAGTATDPAATNLNWRSLISGVMTNEQFASAASKMMIGGMRQGLEQRLASLKLRLNLSEQQDQQFRAMVDRKLATATDLTTRMIQGKASKEDQQALGALYSEAKAEMQQILTPAQLAEYQKYETEERQARAQDMAGRELSRMQRDLQLTDTQAEQARTILTQQAEKQILDTEGGVPPSGDWAQYLQQHNESKKDALRTVLSPDQLQAYDKIQTSRMNWMRMFTPAAAGQP